MSNLLESVVCGVIVGVVSIIGIIFGMEAMSYILEKIAD